MRIGSPIFLLQMVRIMQSMSIDNSVIGTPTVQCERDYIRFAVNTEKPFKGKVFVKGEYTNDQCVRNFAQTGTGGGNGQEGNLGSSLLRTSSRLADKEMYGSMTGINDHLRCPPCPVCENGPRTTRQTRTIANIDIKLGTCNAKRARTLSPPGVTISFTVVVSFHENFVTKVDRAYRIQCAYAEIDKTVTSKIDVSMPQSTELTGTIDSPKCEYRIKGSSGKSVKNVRVGDIIEHEWSCSGGIAGMHAILVSNCYAEGGDHQKELVIDKRGCSLDSFVIPTPVYDNKEMSAIAKSIVFKFPDRTDIGFQCDVLVCVRGEQICDQLTPPKCDEIRQRRALINDSSLSAWRLHAEPLNVIDIDENIGDDELAALNRINNEGLSSSFSFSTIAPFCISLANFGLIIAFSTFFFTISIAIVAFIFLFKDNLQK